MSFNTSNQLKLHVVKNNNNYDNQICIEPLGRNLRGAGATQRVSDQRKERKFGRKGMFLA